MRFMMLMIPEGYATASPDKTPDAEAVAAMMKYNEALKEAGVLLSLDGLHPPSDGARVTFKGSAAPQVTPWTVSRRQGGTRRLLDDPGRLTAGGDRLGAPLPGVA